MVIAAVQQDGHSLEYASKEMRSNENVVMAAVQQDGQSLCYGSEDMRGNENVVMAAVQQDVQSLDYASKEMKAKVSALIMEFECNFEVAARALVQSRVLQLSAKYVGDNKTKIHSEKKESRIGVVCISPGGNVVASFILKPDCKSTDLWQRISEDLAVPPPILHLILPSGEQLSYRTQKPWRELFALT